MGMHILVIEDEESINDLICMNLEVTGYQVTSFLDGEEACKNLKEDHSYDCALVDIMLPGKDGFALLPELKGYGIPVIFLTARGEIQNKVKGLREGAEDYIVKPFEMLELLVRIEKVLERNGKNNSKIQKECSRLSRLSVKLLELTGLYEEEKSGLSVQNCRIGSFLDNIKGLVGFSLKEREIQLEIQCSPSDLQKEQMWIF